MLPWCGGTGDYVVIPSGTSVSMKYRLLHPSESKGKHALGETKKKELCFVLQCLYLEFILGDSKHH